MPGFGTNQTRPPRPPRRRANRPPRRKPQPRPLPWGSVGIVLLLLIALPTAFDVTLAHVFPRLVAWLQYGVTGVYALTSVLLVWEASAAWRLKGRERREAAGPDEAGPLPACTAIIAAFLPNEQGIILDTVRHMLERVDVPPDLFQVILAYNTPETLAVEDDLKEIAGRDPRLLLLRVAGSRSKAENVNAALGAATGEIVAVFDADHLPAPDCFCRAWRRIAGGVDMVQGRCVIHNHAQNWLTRTVAVEFDTIYAVSHPGRACLSGSAIFGGSNGYWRRETLARLGMNPAMLTEDIDVSLRSLLEGCRLVHDRGLVSVELAPLKLVHWVSQRKRWAQGWLEVSLKHTGPLMRSPHFTAGQKALWFYLLVWREVYPALAVQFFPLVLTSLITGIKIHWFGSPLLVAAACLNWGAGPFVLLATYACAPPRARRGLGAWYWVAGLFSLVYTNLKVLVTLVAQVGHLQRDREWVTTPRAAPTPNVEEEAETKAVLEGAETEAPSPDCEVGAD